MTVGAIGLLFVLAVAWLFLSNRKSTQQAAGWQDFYGAVERRSEPLLREVAQRHAGTEVGLWASYSLANFIYNDGAQQLFDDREQANELLLSAQSVYDDVVRQAKQPFLQQRAIFGLAQAFESRNDLLNAGEAVQSACRTLAGYRAGKTCRTGSATAAGAGVLLRLVF